MRRRWAVVAGAALLLAAWSAAWARAPLTDQLIVSGQVTGPGGQKVAGALLSDGHGVAFSDAQGRVRLHTSDGRAVVLSAPPGWRPRTGGWLPARKAAGGGLDLRVVPERPKARRTTALLSDPHFWPRDKDRAARARRIWSDVARELKAGGHDLTVITGDLLMNLHYLYKTGGLAAARKAMATASDAVGVLAGPVMSVPGNHDVLARGGVDFALWRERMGPARQVRFVGRTAFISWDNTGHCGRKQGWEVWCGNTGKEALAWLKAVLAGLPPDTPLVLVTHYPPLSPLAVVNPLPDYSLATGPGGEALARDLDRAAGDIFRLLAGRNVLAWVSGHLHAHSRSLVFRRAGALHLLGLPAVSGAWWRGDRTLDGMRFAPGYVVMTLPRGQAPTYRFMPVRPGR